MSVFIITILIILVFTIIYQISKASEYATVLRGTEKVNAQANRAIAWLLVIMFVLGIWGIWECHELFKDRLLPIAACKTGAKSGYSGQNGLRQVYTSTFIIAHV